MELQNKSAAVWLIAGAGIGAAAMYFWDPNRGRVRRAMLQDQAASLARKGEHEARKRTEDLLNRSKGIVAKADAGLPIEANAVSDDIVVERVRSHLGHLTRHAHDIQTEVNEGVVTLRGAVAPDKHRRLVNDVLAVPSVRGVRDLLVTAKEAACAS